ncbi:MAG TPA: hypothetical protein VF531_11505 [Bacillota bacterium]
MPQVNEDFERFITTRCQAIEKQLADKPEYIEIENSLAEIGAAREIDDLVIKKIVLIEELFYRKGFIDGIQNI